MTAADVVVCGGGIAGLAAAVAAAAEGADVVVLEKSPRCGGSGLLSNGTLWTFADPRIAAEMMPGADHLLQESVIAAADSTFDWLAGLGVRLGVAVDMIHGVGRSVDPLELVARLTDLGGRVLHDTPMLGLEPGLIVRTPSDTFAAGAVVLATGGFQGNPELLSRYGLRPGNFHLRASPWSTGDGLLAALAAGGGTTPGLDGYYGHAMLAPPAPIAPHEFREASQYIGSIAYAVGLDGRRFADETAGTGEESLNEALGRQPHGRGWYLGDARILAMDALPGRLAARTVVDRASAKGAVTFAGSLAELASALPAPRATLLATFDEINRGEWDDLHPPRSRNRYGLTEPPFFAVAVQASVTFTTGGIRVDDEMRVLDRAASTSPLGTLVTDPADVVQTPIPGLYAAGCDIGGLSDGGYLGGLLPALITGRRAGRNAAQRRFAARLPRGQDAP